MRLKSVIHLAIGVALIVVGGWIANGNYLSAGGLVAAFGFLGILVEVL